MEMPDNIMELVRDFNALMSPMDVGELECIISCSVWHNFTDESIAEIMWAAITRVVNGQPQLAAHPTSCTVSLNFEDYIKVREYIAKVRSKVQTDS